ncbi:hypothetical protein [Burkholderia cepacia]|uniref:hypothetical protein n=1 Tax=Burkholderia cepacia TaxID=292 RepID=UPI00158E539F|nr:hypothetical protein [Burkholderia cepacia]
MNDLKYIRINLDFPFQINTEYENAKFCPAITELGFDNLINAFESVGDKDLNEEDKYHIRIDVYFSYILSYDSEENEWSLSNEVVDKSSWHIYYLQDEDLSFFRSLFIKLKLDKDLEEKKEIKKLKI